MVKLAKGEAHTERVSCREGCSIVGQTSTLKTLKIGACTAARAVDDKPTCMMGMECSDGCVCPVVLDIKQWGG
eukprot:1749988-Pleurochrysis_carterae.AAC.3